MNPPHHVRPAKAVRIYCPVEPSTLQALRAGDCDAMSADPVLASLLAVIRGDNPLGDFGLYTGVVELGLGLESFVPTANARPASGSAGQVTVSPTVILTTYLRDDAPQAQVSAALAALVYPTQLLGRADFVQKSVSPKRAKP